MQSRNSPVRRAISTETGPEPGLVIYSMYLHSNRGDFPDTPELSKYIGEQRPMIAIIRQKVKTEPELERYFHYIMGQAAVLGSCWHFDIPLTKKREWVRRVKDPEYTFAQQPWMKLPENKKQPGALYAAHDAYQKFLYRKMYRDVQSAALVFEMQSQTEEATSSFIRQIEAVEDKRRLLHPGEEGYDIQQIIFGTLDDYTEEHPIWVNEISPDTKKLVDLYMKSDTMNEMQFSMVKSVLANKDPVTIGLGPPGTGKSRTIAGTVAVGAICGKHSLACAPTNNASLQIHGHLKTELAKMSALPGAAGIKYKLVLFPNWHTTPTELTTRVDHQDDVDETSLSRHFINIMVADITDPTLSQDKRTEATRFMAFHHKYQTGVAVEEDALWFLNKFKKEWRRVLDECHDTVIVMSTCNNAHNLKDAKIWTPQFVIIEEGAFSLEADSLIPLTLKEKKPGHKKGKNPITPYHLEKILLLGDSNQPSPVVLSRGRNEYVKQLKTSLFTRLTKIYNPDRRVLWNYGSNGSTPGPYAASKSASCSTTLPGTSCAAADVSPAKSAAIPEPATIPESTAVT
ncbi:hypothetical protein NA56DRAFT_706062 [Hyaloscypha hepaticicola]|uniref:DNA2/NAM7 helicase helicase domain-containing protein n=1 Tax=Hyaloscypha hepaticicola TaxID=2082293 RepID=A0A2J6PYB3_9HELO|nr:hypothetical protein NA56DRAFT_706062 [Hyaloscypha hepaticicola]